MPPGTYQSPQHSVVYTQLGSKRVCLSPVWFAHQGSMRGKVGASEEAGGPENATS